MKRLLNQVFIGVQIKKLMFQFQFNIQLRIKEKHNQIDLHKIIRLAQLLILINLNIIKFLWE